jgi:hypothetical protein
MNIHQHPITRPLPNAGAGAIRTSRAKAAVFEMVQTLSATAREVLFAYATTGSAVASLAIIAAPHLEMLLRCSFHGRG